MSEDQPLPCPFCGEKPHVGPSTDHWGSSWGFVACYNKQCPTYDVNSGGGMYGGPRGVLVMDGVDNWSGKNEQLAGKTVEFYRQQAIQRWNKRVYPPQITALWTVREDGSIEINPLNPKQMADE